jgi:hypothetical protein
MSEFKDKVKSDFDRAFLNSLFSRIVNKLQGKSNSLLSFHEIIKYVKIKNESYKGMQIVKIDDIVGSEGRYKDFDKEFLPKTQSLRSRWERVDEAHYMEITLPPIHLYQIGKAYFVRDGNHRVSVGKRQGREYIDAEVTEVKVDIPITLDITKESLIKIIIEKEKENFLEITELDKYRDGSLINFSSAGRYDELLNHISGHQYFLGIERKKSVEFSEALLSWYDTIYLPIQNEILEGNILSCFPGRTEADLYLWIVKHWDDLKKKYGQNINIAHAVKSFKDKYGETPLLNLKKFFKGLFTKKGKSK